jgi:hypothetical protein
MGGMAGTVRLPPPGVPDTPLTLDPSPALMRGEWDAPSPGAPIC